MEILGCRKGWSQKKQLGKVLPTRKILEISMGNSIHPWSGSRAYTCKVSMMRVSREGLLCRHDQKEYIRSQATVQDVLTMLYDALSRQPDIPWCCGWSHCHFYSSLIATFTFLPVFLFLFFLNLFHSPIKMYAK